MCFCWGSEEEEEEEAEEEDEESEEVVEEVRTSRDAVVELELSAGNPFCFAAEAEAAALDVEAAAPLECVA